MKLKLFSLTMVLVLVAALFGAPTQANAAGIGYGTKFATAITYQNIGDLDATLSIQFYDANSATVVTWDRPTALKPNASASLFVGSVGNISAGFQGSAMLVSNQPMAAVLVQIGQYTTTPRADQVINRPLSIGLSSGSDFVLVPTVLKGVFANNTIFVVQNADTVGNDLTVTFIPVKTAAVPNPTPIMDDVVNLGVGQAKYYDMDKVTKVPAGFNGSVTIKAVKTGTTTPGSVVATALELATSNAGVKAFEGTSVGGTTLFMPSAFCKYRGGTIDSAYAIQNESNTTDVTVNVTYTSSDVNAPGTYNEGPYTLGPGGKQSLLGCTKAPAGFIGSAVITATGGTIVGIGKITGNGISSAFNGLTAGAQKIALPYIRWTESANWAAGTWQRANIAIQNVGTAPITGDIMVKYYDINGVLLKTHTITADLAVGAKANSNPITGDPKLPEFGQPVAPQTSFGGGAVVEGPAGSLLAVIVRVESFNDVAGAGSWGEDYNGIPIVAP